MRDIRPTKCIMDHRKTQNQATVPYKYHANAWFAGRLDNEERRKCPVLQCPPQPFCPSLSSLTISALQWFALGSNSHDMEFFYKARENYTVRTNRRSRKEHTSFRLPDAELKLKKLKSFPTVTSSNLNRFSKFFHHTTGKRRTFPIKPIYYFPPHFKYVAALPRGI